MGGVPASMLLVSVTLTFTVNSVLMSSMPPVRVTMKDAPSASPTGFRPAWTAICGVTDGWSLAAMVAVCAAILGRPVARPRSTIVSAFSVSTGSSRTRRVVVADGLLRQQGQRGREATV